MQPKPSLPVAGLEIVLLLALSACNMQARTSTPPAVDLPVSPDTPTGMEVTQIPSNSGGMSLRFVDVSEDGSVPAAMINPGNGAPEKPLVLLALEVTGSASSHITLTANGLTALDENDHISELVNPGGVEPFTGQIHWSPLNGAGQYILVATAVDENKQIVSASVSISVVGIPEFTPTPPPLDQAAAVHRITQILLQEYGVSIPSPSIQRFSFPGMPGRSRWISSVYYQDQRYYVELFDDGHYELSPGEYADSLHPGTTTRYVLCKPAGLYKILVVYVDYGNLAVDRSDALAQVPVFANWTNRLYDDFALSQGFSASPLHIQAEAAWISSPPAPGRLLTSAEIVSTTGIDPSGYDLVFEIDLDRNNTVGTGYWKGVIERGGGIALQGCGAYYDGEVNIFSVVMSPVQTQTELHGNLDMDFNHELSHLFGMLDSWPFSLGTIVSPDGQIHDDWIPYVMFGWTDADNDGIPEIIDPTPYGTQGPQP